VVLGDRLGRALGVDRAELVFVSPSSFVDFFFYLLEQRMKERQREKTNKHTLSLLGGVMKSVIVDCLVLCISFNSAIDKKIGTMSQQQNEWYLRFHER
jgi:hypothetical protein